MGFFDPFGGSSGSGGTGIPGKDGRGISTIDFLSSSIGLTPGIQGAIDTYQIKYTDGTKTTYVVKNGEEGSKGDKGDKGDIGATNAEELEQIETNKNNILSIQQTMGDINSVLEEVL